MHVLFLLLLLYFLCFPCTKLNKQQSTHSIDLAPPLTGSRWRMAGDSAGETATLETTPTWAVASVCFVLLSVSILIEHGLHLLSKVKIAHAFICCITLAIQRIVQLFLCNFSVTIIEGLCATLLIVMIWCFRCSTWAGRGENLSFKLLTRSNQVRISFSFSFFKKKKNSFWFLIMYILE